jgi:queuosine precursor transporter
MNFNNRRDIVFLILAGFFVTNAIVAELIGGKLVAFFGLFTQSIGIILWPVVFVLTDLINEHYGKKGVKKLTYITVGLIAYTYILITLAINIPAVERSPISDSLFASVFGQSQWIIFGSLVAFVVSQLADVYVFSFFKKRTGGRMIWLRATGSTVISQLFDTFIVQYIAFVMPGKLLFGEYLFMASKGYVFKLIVAICLTPLIYLGHYAINRFLGEQKEVATALSETAS